MFTIEDLKQYFKSKKVIQALDLLEQSEYEGEFLSLLPTFKDWQEAINKGYSDIIKALILGASNSYRRLKGIAYETEYPAIKVTAFPCKTNFIGVISLDGDADYVTLTFDDFINNVIIPDHAEIVVQNPLMEKYATFIYGSDAGIPSEELRHSNSYGAHLSDNHTALYKKNIGEVDINLESLSHDELAAPTGWISNYLIQRAKYLSVPIANHTLAHMRNVGDVISYYYFLLEINQLENEMIGYNFEYPREVVSYKEDYDFVDRFAKKYFTATTYMYFKKYKDISSYKLVFCETGTETISGLEAVFYRYIAKHKTKEAIPVNLVAICDKYNVNVEQLFDYAQKHDKTPSEEIPYASNTTALLYCLNSAQGKSCLEVKLDDLESNIKPINEDIYTAEMKTYLTDPDYVKFATDNITDTVKRHCLIYTCGYYYLCVFTHKTPTKDFVGKESHECPRLERFNLKDMTVDTDRGTFKVFKHFGNSIFISHGDLTLDIDPEVLMSYANDDYTKHSDQLSEFDFSISYEKAKEFLKFSVNPRILEKGEKVEVYKSNSDTPIVYTVKECREQLYLCAKDCVTIRMD